MLYATKEERLTRDQLKLIPIPHRPDASDWWMGIQHGYLADKIVQRLTLAGFTLIDEVWKTDTNGATLFGSIDLVPPHDRGLEMNIGQDAHFSLGVRHSNNSRYSISFAVGARVTVCSNGLFLGDYILKRRHTTRVDLDALIDNGIEEYVQGALGINTYVCELRAYSLTRRQVDHILMESVRRGLISPSMLGHLDRLWVKPPHREFSEPNLWRLYNAYTQLAKGMKLHPQVKLMRGLKPFMDCVLDRPEYRNEEG